MVSSGGTKVKKNAQCMHMIGEHRIWNIKMKKRREVARGRDGKGKKEKKNIWEGRKRKKILLFFINNDLNIIIFKKY